MAQHISDFCEDKAREGDGSFAIAFALLEVAAQQKAVARSLERLGMGSDRSQGAVELLAKELRDGLHHISEALNDRE